MGIIAKQSIKGSIYTYAGAILGFISAGILMPNFLQKEQIGLINLLISISIAFSQFSSLGFNGVITRLFPYFRNDNKKHHGILTLGVIISLVGFVIVFLFFLFLKDYLVESNIEKSPLFSENLFYLPILVFFLVFFSLFDQYNKALFDAVTGTFLRELYVRILNLALIIIYIFGYVDFKQFVFVYLLIYISPTIIILFILNRRRKFYLGSINIKLFKKYKHEILKISFFSIISGFTWTAVQFIDKYMINHFLDLAATGVYSIAFLFGALIAMPARSVRKISSIILAESWKNNDIETINLIYKKSTINLLIISTFLFVGIWANIDNVFNIIPEAYIKGKYVIFFIGLTGVIEMSSGVGASIIATSKYYRVSAYVMIVMIVLIIITNIIFIKNWGIIGAAFASMISTFTAILIRYVFLLRKFKLQPYSYKQLIIILIAGFSLFTSYLIPEFESYVIDILVRSSYIAITFSGLIYFSKVSEEVNGIVLKYFKKIKSII